MVSFTKNCLFFLIAVTTLGSSVSTHGQPLRPTYQPYVYEDIQTKLKDVTPELLQLKAKNFSQGARDWACLPLSFLYATTHDDLFPIFWKEKIFKDTEGNYYVKSPDEIFHCISKEFITHAPTKSHPSKNPLLRALTGYYEVCQMNELGLEKKEAPPSHTIYNRGNCDALFGGPVISLTKEEAIQVYKGTLGLKGILSVGQKHRHALSLFLRDGKWRVYDNNKHQDKPITLKELEQFTSWDLIVYPEE